MLVYDYYHPEVFLNADRASSRWNSVEALSEAWRDSATIEYLSSQGNPGDYLPQAMLLFSLGKFGLIAAQIVLVLLSGYAVYRIARILGMSVAAAQVSAVLYLVLPHSLVFAHQLATEAIHVPLLLISTWLLLEYCASRRLLPLWVSGLLVGLTNLVRPVTILWPVLGASMLARIGTPRAVSYLALAYLPVLVWVTFVHVYSGEGGLGASSRDMGHNLYQRVVRISKTLPSDASERVAANYLNQGETGTLSPVEYAAFVVEYPKAATMHSLRDLAVFAGKSGIERLTIDYFALGEGRRALQDNDTGWRYHLETQGVVATMAYLWRTQGVVLIASLIGAAFMVLLLLAAVLGGVRLLLEFPKFDLTRQIAAVLVLALPIYVAVFSQVVNAVQSRHRAPAEGAIVMLAVYGAVWLRGEIARRSRSSAA